MADGDQLLGKDLNNANADLGNQQSNQDVDYLDVLVGEGKKYADNGNLAKGYANLQVHNTTILKEKTDLQAAYDLLLAQNKTVDSVLAAIQNPQSNQQSQADLLAQQAAADQGLSKEDIVAIITGTLDKRDDASAAQTQVDAIKGNQAIFWGEASKVYGSEAKAEAAVAMYVGTDPKKRELVKQLGSFDPKTLVSVLQTAIPVKGEQMDFGLADLGNENAKKVVTVPSGLVTYDQAEAVRKGNKKLYNSRDFQMKLHASCEAGVWKRPNKALKF